MHDKKPYKVVSLRKIISTLGREETEGLLAKFESVHGDSSPVQFLHKKAIIMELKDLSRTHVAITDDWKILGFFSLGLKSMSMPDETALSNTTIKRMNVDPVTGDVQAYLIGQLCRARDSPLGFGKALLDRAFRKIWPSFNSVGCRVVRLDCEDALVKYYEKNGFRLVKKDPEGKLNQMIAFVDDNARFPRRCEDTVASSVGTR